jgi:hypothetical protein
MVPWKGTLQVPDSDRQVALRVLSAVIFGWDRIPFAPQGWLLRDASMMRDGSPASAEQLLAFIDAHKNN